MTHLKVIVRVRPFSQREKDDGCEHVVKVESNNTVAIENLKVARDKSGDSRERVRRFTFDHCFGEDATQNDIFSEVESIVSRSIKKKHHTCVLAYGQSATGKTHTMMGYPHDPGLSPKLCQNISEYFQDVIEEKGGDMKITLSYLEVYNEKVWDLLQSESEKDKYSAILRIREHPKRGPYVQGLTEQEVRNQHELLHWIHVGSENRRVASNQRNSHSSRSHSVVTISCNGVRLYLVDLAGSEKAGAKVWASSTIREGANINKSLVALGNVISALAEQPQKLKTNRKRFVPYRDSVLTWLLKDTLGGNSNTIMIATISPASGCYSETVNTLRFGQRAKLIICNPVVIEDPKEKIIKELRLEIAKLKKELEELKVEQPSSMPKLDQAVDEPNTTELHLIPTCLNNGISVLDRTKKIEGKSLDKYNLQKNTDKLTFIMNVETSVSPEKRQIPKLRRTSSVQSVALINRSRTPSFGSRESISTTESSSRKSSLSASAKMSSSNPMIRRRSVDKTTTMKKNILSASKKSAEKSVETEGAMISRSKTFAHTRTTPVNKSNIIANVTKRLYAKTKNSETDMEGFDEPKNDTPKELAICSNARNRLKELTQKAMRAHRFKQVETQTDTIVLRVKEVSTDVQDLRLRIPEVKEVETMTNSQKQDTRDALVGCSMLDNFKMGDSDYLFKVTKSIGTQCNHDWIEEPNSQTEQRSSPVLSFTKFLVNQILPCHKSIINVNSINAEPVMTRGQHLEVQAYQRNTMDLNPIVAEQGRIRVQELETVNPSGQNMSGLSFLTPDLISNHNSLDLTVPITQIEEPNISDKQLRYALDNTEHVPYDSLEFSEITPLEFESANACLISSDHEEQITKYISEYTLYPEVSVCECFSTCDYISSPKPELFRTVAVYVKEKIRCDAITLYEPTILEPCGGISKKLFAPTANDSSVNMNTVSEPHSKSKSKPRNTKNKQKMVEAMTIFLEEAAKLMKNLTKASESFGDADNTLAKREFELHITSENVNDLRDLFGYQEQPCRKPKQREFVPCYESSAQTSSIGVASHSTQYESYDIPSNEFDVVLNDTCKTLESLTNKGMTPKRFNSSKDSAVSFSSELSEIYPDFSLGSNDSWLSDYGSLRQNMYKKIIPRCSPSELLKQLSLMRSHVMKTSKECLQNGEVLGQSDVF